MSAGAASTATASTGPVPDVPAWHRRRSRWIKGLLVVICLGIASMWVYGLWFASKEATYRVNDAAWRANAEVVCADYERQRLELVDTSEGYIANPTEAQMMERADIVDRATDLLTAELRDISDFPVSTERDRDLIAEYVAFYDTLISDRRVYTAKLRAFQVEPYTETKVQGGPVTNVILDFTTVNQIKSCQPPGELGGDA